VSPAETAEPIEMPLGQLGLVGSRNHVLWGVDIQQENAAIIGVVRPTENHWDTLQRCINKLHHPSSHIKQYSTIHM